MPLFFVFILILELIYYTMWLIFCFRNKLDEDINDILSDTHVDDELSVKVSLEWYIDTVIYILFLIIGLLYATK